MSHANYFFDNYYRALREKKDFAEGSKILLDTNLKIILLSHQNNFVGILQIMNNAKNVDILAIILSILIIILIVQQNYLFDLSR